jgi:nitrite reductase (NADH) small subunit
LSAGRQRVRVCRAEELPPGERRIVPIAEIEVGVFNLGDRLVAYRNLCPHQGAPVCTGRVGGTTLPSAPGEYVYGRHGRILHCPWHGWQFDLDTGEALFGHRVRLAPVEVELTNDSIVVTIGKGEPR